MDVLGIANIINIADVADIADIINIWILRWRQVGMYKVLLGCPVIKCS
jgi:hypothetical protein